MTTFVFSKNIMQMDAYSTHYSELFLSSTRGALLVFFLVMCAMLRNRRKENPILTSLFWLTSAMAVLLAISLSFMFDALKNSEYFRTLKILINVCFVPLAGGYLLRILIPGKIHLWVEILLSVPTVACLALYATIENDILVTISLTYTSVLLISMILFVIYLSRKYDRYLKDNFSNIDNMNVQWVRVFVLLCATWYVIWHFMIRQEGYLPEAVYYLYMALVWIYIYRYSGKHIAATIHIWELFPTGKTEDTAAAKIECATKENLEKALDIYMNEKEHWLNPELTLQDMATDLGTNRTYLSEHFNNTLNTTFYDYLNRYKIEYACEILSYDAKIPIFQVAELTGFNSRATFNRTFEKHVGTTPSEYRKKRKKH